MRTFINNQLNYFLVFTFSFLLIAETGAQSVLSPNELLKIKSCGSIMISPNGKEVLYLISSQRGANEEPGGSYSELYKVSVSDGKITGLITGKINIHSPRWSPDGKWIGFLHHASGSSTQVWIIPANGGEMTQLTSSPTSVSAFKWNPSGKHLTYLALTPETDHEKDLKKKGYDFIYYEENLKSRNLYTAGFNKKWKLKNTRQITTGKMVWDFTFSLDGKQVAASISNENLIDQRYMFRKIYLINQKDGSMIQVSTNEGKLGNYAFSPDGLKLAYTAALDREDHQVSQLFIADLKTKTVKNLSPPDFKGHINQVAWIDNEYIIYHSGEGTKTTLASVKTTGEKRQIIMDGEKYEIVFSMPDYTEDFQNFAFTGSNPYNPGEIYYWDGKEKPQKLTDLNPGIKQSKLGEQKVIRYDARDGLEIEGLLIYPTDFKEGEKYPLIVYVHGGPEAHYSNTWLSRYSTPGQVMAGKGYLIFYPNYRGSTGYGVKFSMESYGDPAGKEFDDIADGIDYLINEGLADKERVGLAGGSYGGYASAWFATYYTKYVRAVCMFVGISDLISKRGTTDIAREELYVHSGKKLEDMWKFSLERSPVYWAHQSKTATLIYGGASDTRVHPSQSFELFRRMKMNDHPAVRLVQYPGEGHGNRKQVGQIDVLYRQIQWLDWYVKDKRPLEGPMPPLDISDNYGLE